MLSAPEQNKKVFNEYAAMGRFLIRLSNELFLSHSSVLSVSYSKIKVYWAAKPLQGMPKNFNDTRCCPFDRTEIKTLLGLKNSLV